MQNRIKYHPQSQSYQIDISASQSQSMDQEIIENSRGNRGNGNDGCTMFANMNNINSNNNSNINNNINNNGINMHKQPLQICYNSNAAVLTNTTNINKYAIINKNNGGNNNYNSHYPYNNSTNNTNLQCKDKQKQQHPSSYSYSQTQQNVQAFFKSKTSAINQQQQQDINKTVKTIKQSQTNANNNSNSNNYYINTNTNTNNNDTNIIQQLQQQLTQQCNNKTHEQQQDIIQQIIKHGKMICILRQASLKPDKFVVQHQYRGIRAEIQRDKQDIVKYDILMLIDYYQKRLNMRERPVYKIEMKMDRSGNNIKSNRANFSISISGNNDRCNNMEVRKQKKNSMKQDVQLLKYKDIQYQACKSQGKQTFSSNS